VTELKPFHVRIIFLFYKMINVRRSCHKHAAPKEKSPELATRQYSRWFDMRAWCLEQTGRCKPRICRRLFGTFIIFILLCLYRVERELFRRVATAKVHSTCYSWRHEREHNHA